MRHTTFGDKPKRVDKVYRGKQRQLGPLMSRDSRGASTGEEIVVLGNCERRLTW